MHPTSRNTGSGNRGKQSGRNAAEKCLRRLALLTFALLAAVAHAVEPSWQRASMHYVARNTPLADVLRDVGTAGGVPFDVAREVRGTVNGSFDEEPSSVFQSLVDAYGLAWYFDGRAIHVSAPADVRSRTIAFAPMTRESVATLLQSLALDDPHLPVRYSDTTAKVSGPSRYVDALADAISNAQAQTQISVPSMLDQTVIRVFPLRYAQAQDITYRSGNREQVLPGVATLLRNLVANIAVERRTARARGTESAARPNRNGPPPLPGLRGLGLADSGEPDVPPQPAPQIAAADATPARRNIIADTRTNSVVICDVPEMMPSYEHAIAMLDRPQDLVEITAAVIDVSSQAAQQLGVNWNAGVRQGSARSWPDAASRLMPLVGQLASVAPGLNLSTLIAGSADYLFAQIHVLEQRGEARVLSRPQVLTLNNQEAVLSSRSSMYVRVAGNQDVDLYNVDTGLMLKVTPTVEQDGDARRKVLMSVQIEDGDFDTSKPVDGIPTVNNHSITTQATVGDGESLLIGGFQYEHSERSTAKVPVLGDIPVIGALFGDSSSSETRTERLVLITPRIVRTVRSATPPLAAGAARETVAASASVPALASPAPAPAAGPLRARLARNVREDVTPLPPGVPPGARAPSGATR